MFKGKSSPPQNDSSVSCPLKNPSTSRVPKINSAELEAFSSTVERNYLLTYKDELRSLTTWRKDILFNQIIFLIIMLHLRRTHKTGRQSVPLIKSG